MNYNDEIEEIAYIVRNVVDAAYFGVGHVSFDSADILRNFCEPLFSNDSILFPAIPEIEPGECDRIRWHLFRVIAHAERLLSEMGCRSDT